MKKLLFKNGPQALPHEAVNYDTASFSIRINVPYTGPNFPDKPVAPPSGGTGKYGNLKGHFTDRSTSDEWVFGYNIYNTFHFDSYIFDVPWDIELTNLERAFGSTVIRSIERMPDLSTVTDMNGFAESCEYLETVDMTGWNTSKVTDMNYMFYNCQRLKTITAIGNLKTSLVTNMNHMFDNCVNWQNWATVSDWDVTSVNSMDYMFSTCAQIMSIDLSNWKTQSLTSMENMFGSCDKLSSVKLDDWDVTSVNNVSLMFNYCSNLQALSVRNWDFNLQLHAPNAIGMLQGCKALKKLSIGNVGEDMYAWWCNRLTEAGISTSIIDRR